MGQAHTILIADDAVLFRELGSVFLERTGRVITARDGRESLCTIREEDPDVVVADLDMPNMSGDELCRQIKQNPETRNLPVILLTGTDLAADRARAVRAGADDIVAKPLSRLALVRSVNRFLGSPHHRSMTRVPFEADVQIVESDGIRVGTARNLSRGGMFVEADPADLLDREVTLEFHLPDEEYPVTPTAQVAWRRPPGRRTRAGAGLQFLALDRSSCERIDSFVYENTVPATNTGDSR